MTGNAIEKAMLVRFEISMARVASIAEGYSIWTRSNGRSISIRRCALSHHFLRSQSPRTQLL